MCSFLLLIISMTVVLLVKRQNWVWSESSFVPTPPRLQICLFKPPFRPSKTTFAQMAHTVFNCSLITSQLEAWCFLEQFYSSRHFIRKVERLNIEIRQPEEEETMDESLNLLRYKFTVGMSKLHLLNTFSINQVYFNRKSAGRQFSCSLMSYNAYAKL